jgi:hypothetical protein
MAGAINSRLDLATTTYLAKYKQILSYGKGMTNLQFIPQSGRKERIEKTMSINHTKTISINYTIQQTPATYPQQTDSEPIVQEAQWTSCPGSVSPINLFPRM